jgi:hydroxyacylglutathione hydrolase
VVREAMLVGHERFAGVLEGGVRDWREAGYPIVTTEMADEAETASALAEGAEVVDVREPDEVAAGTIEGAVTIPLGDLVARASSELPKNRPVLTMCAAGERSITAASILEREGFGKVVNMSSGYDGWRAAQA